MKIKRIYIRDIHGKTLYKGPLMGLNFKKESVLDMCMELFSDPNPCVIHESYAIQKLSEEAEAHLTNNNLLTYEINRDFCNMLSMLDLNEYENMSFIIEAKK